MAGVTKTRCCRFRIDPRAERRGPSRLTTSVGIVYNYLDYPDWHRGVPAMTNDHFDEDGLTGLFCMIEAVFAL